MDETQLKRRRKSKLMHQTDIEMDDDYIEILRLQNSVQEVSSIMKNMTSKNFKQANRNFAVAVTVEQVKEEKIEEETIDKANDKDDYKFKTKQKIIDRKRMWQVMESISILGNGFTNYADRQLAVEVGNTWGRLETENYQESKKELAIQQALFEWQTWFRANKSIFSSVETPTSYKCYVCSKGWWRLNPFREHIETHEEELKVSVETLSLQCNMIAYIGEKPEPNVVPIAGCCLKCFKYIEDHDKHKCDTCLKVFAYCSAFYRHNCLAPRLSRVEILGPDILTCTICGYKCKSSTMNNHRLLKHTVPSDEPVDFLPKKHKDCGMKYVCLDSHACPTETRQIYCNYCTRKFHNGLLSKLHMEIANSDVTCQICSELLPRQCMLMEHLSAHSEHFAMVPKCSLCTVPVVFPDDVSAKYHMKACHDKIETRNRTFHDMVIIPKVIVQKWPSNDLMDISLLGFCFSAAINKQKNSITDNVKNNEDSNNIINNAKSKEVEIEKKANEHNLSIDDFIKNTKISTNNKNVESSKSTHNETDDEYNELVIDETYDDDLILIESDSRKDNVIEIIDISDSDEETNNEKESKDDVESIKKIKEDCVVIDSIKINKNVDPKVLVIKSQKSSKEVANENLKVTNENSQTIKEIYVDDEHIRKIVEKETGVEFNLSVIKQELDDDFELEIDEELYVDDLVIKKESDDCNEVLTHIFEASKSNNHFEADDETNIGVIIKTETDVVQKKEDENKFDADLNETKESGVRKFLSSEEKIKWRMLRRRLRKIYNCKKCSFQGFHKAYAQHRAHFHPPKRRHNRLRRRVSSEVDTKMHESASENMYNCTKCLRKFKSYHTYVYHFVCHDIKPNTCPLCETVFDVHLALCNHIQNYHIVRSFVSFRVINKEKSSQEENYEQKYKNRPFKCTVCGNKVLRQHFFIHWENHFQFKVSNQHLIPIEERKVKNALSAQVLEELKDAIMGNNVRELNRKSKVERRTCLVCSKFSNRIGEAKRHLIEHLLSDAYATYPLYDAFRCQFCGEKFDKTMMYKQHMRDHGNLPIYRCELCDKMFSDSSNFTKHKKVHSFNKAFVCDLCKKKFQSKMSLEKHLQDHDKPVTCKLCRRVFPLNAQYRKHLKTYHHKRELRFPCRICKEKFPSLKANWDHMWSVHKSRKTKQDCKICGMAFRKLIDLKKHFKYDHSMPFQ